VISRGFFGETFDEAAFGLEEGDVSQPVELDNAFHIIQVTDIQGPTFEEQRDELAREVALRAVDDEFNQRVQQLIDESFAADDLQSVADSIGLALNQSDWLARNDEAEGVLSEPGVMSAAFSNDVLVEGYNSEVIELDRDRRLVLQVAEQRDAALLPLDEVREEVEIAVAAEQQQQVLREEAQVLVADLREGQQVDVDWLEANNVSRQADTTVPQSIVQEAFRMQRPEEDESVYRTVELPQGVAVVALDGVSDGEVDEQMETFVSQMAEQLRAQSVLQGLIDDLRSDAEIAR
jgi:peptidyl-prolyl cis-trans isomerase D